MTRIDGHDHGGHRAALDAAQASDRPSFIACKTIIGYGAPNKQGTAATHGSPLGADEVAAARKTPGWEHPPFEVPADILAFWRAAGAAGAPSAEAWEKRLAAEQRQAPNSSAPCQAPCPQSFDETMPLTRRSWRNRRRHSPRATPRRMRSMSSTPAVPETIGGSADLTGSNNTKSKDLKPLTAADYGGRYIHYGIREHAMAAAMNGMAVHGGVIPYGGTFLVFTDYCRPSIRLSALMGSPGHLCDDP